MKAKVTVKVILRALQICGAISATLLAADGVVETIAQLIDDLK